MNKKAIILSHEDGGTYVLEKNGSFTFVKGHENKLIGEEIDLDTNGIKKTEVIRQPFFRQYKSMLIAASLVIMIALGGFTWMWNAESHSIYVDMNAGVELVFNRFNRLITANAINEDGEEIAYTIDRGLNPSEAVVHTVNEIYENGSGENNAAVIAFSDNGTYHEKAPAIADALYENGLDHLNIKKLYANQCSSRARELGVSPGRLCIAKQAYTNSELSLYDLLDMPLGDLKHKIS